MAHMLWAVFALVAGISYAAQAEINKHFKIDGLALNTWRALFAACLMLPLLPWMEWPHNPRYYAVIVLDALINVFCMKVLYNLAAKGNGRVACMHQPVVIVLTFGLWLALEKAQRQFFMHHPGHMLAIVLAVGVFSASLYFVRKNDAGWAAFVAVLPVAVLYAVMLVISKLALDMGRGLMPISLNFVFLGNVCMFLISLPFFFKKGHRLRLSRAWVARGGLISLVHTFSWVCVSAALVLAPSPAYVSVITALTPVWFMIYYRLCRYEDGASPIAGGFMAVAAVIVLLAS